MEVTVAAKEEGANGGHESPVKEENRLSNT